MYKGFFIRGRIAPLLIHGALLVLVLGVLCTPLPGEGGPPGQDRQDFTSRLPQRLISLAPSITEILYFLELGDKVVGVTSYCNYPAEVKEKPRVGTYWEYNLEAILALKPDLALVMADQAEGESSLAGLRHWGIPVYRAQADTLPQLFQTIEDIARLTGQEEVARRRLPKLKARVHRVEAAVHGLPRLRVFLQIDEEPLITAGRAAVHHDLIQRAGGLNIAGFLEPRYPIFSLEEVLKAQPQVILFTSMVGEQALPGRLAFWRRWPMLPAVAEGRLHWVDPDLIDRPGPRLVDGLELLARLFHPETAGGVSPESRAMK
jgi:iron complex transport system substrate-binding protein